MNFVFIYYNQPQMLARQIACWNTYATLPNPPKIILVDDGSRLWPALDVVSQHPLDVALEVYRIEEDIPWNFTGARNLGCTQSHDWMYISDIDTLLLEEHAGRLIAAATDEKCFYLPRRRALPYGRPMRPTVVNVSLHRSLFENVGGHDEDYAGHYGREEFDFHERLSRIAPQIDLPDVAVHLVPDWMIPDARTIGGNRSMERNQKLIATKRVAGFPPPGSRLRFKWTRQK